MTVETSTYINSLNTSLPAGGDQKAEGDDHIRLIKSNLKNTFPNITGAVTPTHTELNYVDGVTSAIQPQLDGKIGSASPVFTGNATFGGTATGITDLTTTGNTVLGDASTDTLNVGNGGLVKDASGNVLIGTTTSLQGAAGRGCLEINGSSDSIIEFKKSNVGQGFVYFDPSGNGFFTASLAAGLNFSTSGATRLTINSAGVIQDGSSNELGFKGLPAASVTTGAFVAADRGKVVNATGGVTIPNAVMSAGDVVVIFNNSASPITITATITSLKLAGTSSTGNRTLAQWGMASVYFVNSASAVISGAGVS